MVRVASRADDPRNRTGSGAILLCQCTDAADSAVSIPHIITNHISPLTQLSHFPGLTPMVQKSTSSLRGSTMRLRRKGREGHVKCSASGYNQPALTLSSPFCSTNNHFIFCHLETSLQLQLPQLIFHQDFRSILKMSGFPKLIPAFTTHVSASNIVLPRYMPQSRTTIQVQGR